MSEQTYEHRWSGWPGAFCLKCGQDDKMETAISCCLFDPYTETWKEGVNPEDYYNGKCLVSDEEHEEQLKKYFDMGPECWPTGETTRA